MKRPNSSSVLSGCALVGLIFSACSVDSRGLTYEFHALETGGGRAFGGNAGAPASESAGDHNVGGEGGAPEYAGTGADSGASSPNSGSDNGGAAGEQSNGNAATGGTLSGAGAENGGTTAAGASPVDAGNSGGAASSVGGGAGSLSGGGCADLNQDQIDDCTQTLVQNSRFDSTASGWIAETFITATWSPMDGSGQPGSGSLLLSNAGPVAQSAGTFMGGADQCIPTELDASYDVAARVMVGPGQADAAGGIDVWMYDDDACKGNLVTAKTPLLGGVSGQWTILRGALSVPGGVHSLSIRLVVAKPFVETVQTVFVDDVLFAKL